MSMRVVVFICSPIGPALDASRLDARTFSARKSQLHGPERLRRGPEATTDRAGGDASAETKASPASRQRQRTPRGRLTVSGPARDLRGSASPSIRRRTPGRVCMTAERELHAVVEALPPSAEPAASSDRGYARERGCRVGVADRGSIPRRSTKSPTCRARAASGTSVQFSQVRRGGSRGQIVPGADEAKERLAARPARVVEATGTARERSRRSVSGPVSFSSARSGNSAGSRAVSWPSQHGRRQRGSAPARCQRGSSLRVGAEFSWEVAMLRAAIAVLAAAFAIPAVLFAEREQRRDAERAIKRLALEARDEQDAELAASEGTVRA